MFRAFLLSLCLATPLAAQDSFPWLHDVVNVAADDTLNVREGPSSKTPVVGELAYDAAGIEVLREENGWGLVNVDERAGWAYMRYLTPRAEGGLANAQHLDCFGTEPFWGLDVTSGQTARLTSPENMEGEAFSIGLLGRLYAPAMKYAVQGTGDAHDLSLMVMPAYCDDGMSDREYALDATVFLSGAESRAYSGCCTLAD